VYALKGLSGGYTARYHLQPYFVQVAEYGGREDREVWEFPLALTDHEVRRLILHIWELREVEFEYYFIDENCSFQLVSLLAVVRPEAELLDAFTWFTVPLDSVLAVVERIGLRADPQYRESRTHSIRRQSLALSDKSRSLAAALSVSGPADLQAELESLTTNDTARVLDLALDLLELQARSGDDLEGPSEALTPVERSLLEARHGLQVPLSRSEAVKEIQGSPVDAHPSQRLSIGSGTDADGANLLAEFRFLYHDQSDSSRGYGEGIGMEFLRAQMRYDLDTSALRLEEAVLFRLESQAIFEPLLQTPSWGVSLDTKRMHFGDDGALVASASARGGITLAGGERVRLSGLLNAGAHFNDRFDQGAAFSLGLELIARVRLSPELDLGLHIEGARFGGGYTESTYSVGLEQVVRLNQTHSLLLKAARKAEFGDSFVEGGLSWRWYF
jgi:hypothetical protein